MKRSAVRCKQWHTFCTFLRFPNEWADLWQVDRARDRVAAAFAWHRLPRRAPSRAEKIRNKEA